MQQKPQTRKRRNLNSKELIEVSVIFGNQQQEASEILQVLFIRLGFSPEEIIQYKQDSQFSTAVFLSSWKKARRLKQTIDEMSLKNIEVKLTKFKRSDWQEKWKTDFVPFSLTQGLDVVPVWRKKDYKIIENRKYVLIDTITAFGTGLHDTTRFMSLFIEKYQGKFMSFLDIGTGTGILSLVALKYGAKYVCAIDYGKESITVARANLLANKCSIQCLKRVDIRDFKNDHLFDFVAANLTSCDLNTFKKKIFSFVKPEKFLAISGIRAENSAWIKREFEKFPLRCLKIFKSKDWNAFLYKRLN